MYSEMISTQVDTALNLEVKIVGGDGNSLQQRRAELTPSLRSTAYPVNAEVFDISATAAGQGFKITIQRCNLSETNLNTYYIVVLLDGVIHDHFRMDPRTSVISSHGWRESERNLYRYNFAIPQIRVLYLDGRSPSLGTATLGNINVRVYDCPPELIFSLNYFLRQPSKHRNNSPRLEYYASVQFDSSCELPEEPHVFRISPDGFKRLPVPRQQFFFRYGKEKMKKIKIEEKADATDASSSISSNKLAKKSATDTTQSKESGGWKRKRPEAEKETEKHRKFKRTHLPKAQQQVADEIDVYQLMISETLHLALSSIDWSTTGY
ncbi:hypothetical protein M422DRAFT_52907 [Sphaerobolus stellatus SS14]|uniref:Uncharacterized protein n=1 Tax=Sphaerobolus stellatus (strain SS14) TaxID=990650 RepID=A0A0C9TQE7_SPHS4|nr:hypothetical protein M422DRAFT_52907 [Sphaerobolus stellatus SS14]